MEALFVIPTMVSPNVNSRLIPAISKMVERNTLLINSATFRSAAIKKYSGLFKTVRSETSEMIYEIDYDADDKPKTMSSKEKRQAVSDLYKTATSMTTKSQELPSKPTFTEPEKIEIPQGIQFFHTIGLEPTILEIPISLKATIIGGSGTRNIRIGVKCVPYIVKGVEDIISMMTAVRNREIIKKSFLSKMGIVKRKVLSTNELRRNVSDIILAPSAEDLSDSGYVKKMMVSGRSTSWSVLTILSSYDFEEGSLEKSLSEYRELVRRGWGDMVIVNEPNESVHFCVAKMNACYELSFSYIKQLLNLSNVLDYSEVSKWSRPLHISTIGKALRDSVGIDSVSDDVNAKIIDIING